MAKGEFGFVHGSDPDAQPRTWKKGFFTYTEIIEPGVVYLYNCKYERGDSSNTAPTVQSTPRLSPQEVERRFADFVAAHGGHDGV